MGIFKSGEDRHGSWILQKPLELNFPQVGGQEPPKQVVVGWRATAV